MRCVASSWRKEAPQTRCSVSLGPLVMSIIHGLKAKTGPLPPPESRGIIGSPRAVALGGRRLQL